MLDPNHTGAKAERRHRAILVPCDGPLRHPSAGGHTHDWREGRCNARHQTGAGPELQAGVGHEQHSAVPQHRSRGRVVVAWELRPFHRSVPVDPDDRSVSVHQQRRCPDTVRRDHGCRVLGFDDFDQVARSVFQVEAPDPAVDCGNDQRVASPCDHRNTTTGDLDCLHAGVVVGAIQSPQSDPVPDVVQVSAALIGHCGSRRGRVVPDALEEPDAGPAFSRVPSGRLRWRGVIGPGLVLPRPSPISSVRRLLDRVEVADRTGMHPAPF